MAAQGFPGWPGVNKAAQGFPDFRAAIIGAAAPPPGPAPETPYTETYLLVHSDDPNGSVVFLDSSQYARTISATGDVNHATAQKKFRATSMEFDGAGDYWQIAQAVIGKNITTLSIDMWVYMTASNTATDRAVIIGDSEPAAASSYLSFGTDNNDKLVLRWWDGASKTAVSGGSVPLSTWTHIAVSVDAGAISLYIDGVTQTITGATTLTARTGEVGKLTVGVSNNVYYNGYIDELRVLVGAAPWAANFTPPTAPYILAAA